MNALLVGISKVYCQITLSMPIMLSVLGSKNSSTRFVPGTPRLVKMLKEYWLLQRQQFQRLVPGWLGLPATAGTSLQMPRQKQGGRPTWAGLRSLVQEPQILICVIGPLAVHRKSSAKILGAVAGTSIPLVSGNCSHFCGTALMKGEAGQSGGAALVASVVRK